MTKPADIYPTKKVSEDFHVSQTTVQKWIKSAEIKENNLQIRMVGKKNKIINNDHNRSLLLNLSNNGQKFKNKIDSVVVEPKPEFYEIFDKRQQAEIVNSIMIEKEIPMKFGYMNRGSKFWDQASSQDSYSTRNINSELLLIAKNYFDYILPKDYKINIIEIGAGNGLYLKSVLEEYYWAENLNNFVTIDISSEMADITLKNVNSWLPDLKLSSRKYDFEIDTFPHIYPNNSNNSTTNILQLIGGTYGNAADREIVLKNIKRSLGPDDYFILADGVRNENWKSSFDHIVSNKSFINTFTWLIKTIGINVSDTEIVYYYDEKSKSKYVGYELKKDYKINFKKNYIKLGKGSKIRFFRHYSPSLIEILNELNNLGFSIEFVSKSKDNTDFIIICKPHIKQ